MSDSKKDESIEIDIFKITKLDPIIFKCYPESTISQMIVNVYFIELLPGQSKFYEFTIHANLIPLEFYDDPDGDWLKTIHHQFRIRYPLSEEGYDYNKLFQFNRNEHGFRFKNKYSSSLNYGLPLFQDESMSLKEFARKISDIYQKFNAFIQPSLKNIIMSKLLNLFGSTEKDWNDYIFKMKMLGFKTDYDKLEFVKKIIFQKN